MKFTEFFWDFDGTLFNTYPRINRCMLRALTELGVETNTEAVAKLTKVHIGHAASVLLPSRRKEVMELFHKYYYDMKVEDMQFDSIIASVYAGDAIPESGIIPTGVWGLGADA